MATRILHVSDTHLGKNAAWLPDEATDYADALSWVVTLASKRSIDAVIHTGDLFDVADPDPRMIDAAVEAFNHLNSNPISGTIPVYLVHGDHDLSEGQTPGVDSVCQRSHAERLGHTPVVIGDRIALFGLHNDEIRANGPSVGGQLERPPTALESIVCLHEMPRKQNYGSPDDIRLSVLESKIPFGVRLFAGGDLHRAKRWETWRETSCCYPGATVPTHQRYWDYDPLVYIYDFPDKGEPTSTGVHVDSRPYYDVSVDIKPDDSLGDVTHAVFEDIVEQDGGEPLDKPLSEAVLRVLLSGTGETVTRDDVQEFFEDYGLFSVQVQVSDWGFFLSDTDSNLA